jgi:alpha-1,2-mannosyltransferase
LGGHLKLYPVIFGALWLVQRRWKALFGLALAGLALAAFTLLLPGGASLWQAYIETPQPLLQGSILQDNSLRSLIYNTLRFTGLLSRLPQPDRIVTLVSILASVAALAWLVVRYLRRRALAFPAPMLAAADAADLFAAMLLVSPVAWEHHYLLSLPLLIYGAAAAQRQRRWLPWLAAAALIAWVPTFNFYPFSYHLLAGLLILLKLYH